MESVPEEKNQTPNDNESHDESGDKDGYVFSSLDILETIGVVLFEGTGLALHEAEFHIWGFAFDFFAFLCGLLVVRHRLQNSKFKWLAAPHFYWLSVFCAFLLFAFLAWSVSFKKSEQSTPKLIHILSIFENISSFGNERFLLWHYQTEALAPIGVEALLNLQNLTDHRIKFDSFQFEGKNKNGDWIVFPIIDHRFGDMVYHQGNYWGVQNPNENPDFQKIYLPAVLENGIPASEPIIAYALLEIPGNATVSELRFRAQTPFGEILESVEGSQTNYDAKMHPDMPVITFRPPPTNTFKDLPIVPYHILKKKYAGDF